MASRRTRTKATPLMNIRRRTAAHWSYWAKSSRTLNSGHTVALQLIAVANVLTGETQGDTSHFAGQSDELIGATEFHAEIVAIVVKGQPFVDVDFEFPEGNEGGRGEHHEH